MDFLFVSVIILLWIDYGIKLNGVAAYSIKSINISYSTVTSGVTWSLWYEWLLYFSLPLFSVLLFGRIKISYGIFSLIIIVALNIIWKYDFSLFSYFFVGGLAFFIKEGRFAKLMSNKDQVRGMALILSLIGYYYFEYSNKILGFAFLFVLFLMIVLEADIFGILASKVSQYLSEMGYSLYLLQGPFIYLFWKILGFEFVSNLNEWQYVVLIFLVTPIYVLMCDWSYKFIEAKFKSENIYKIFQIGRGKSNEYRD